MEKRSKMYFPYTAMCAASALILSSLCSARPSSGLKVSPNGHCGPQSGYTCQGSHFGNSCGKQNRCGKTCKYSYSLLSRGCQPEYGFCYAPGSKSPDGSCGNHIDQFTCRGSAFGESCGQDDRCGQGYEYSGNGCQSKYGYCQRCTVTIAPTTKTVVKQVKTTVTVSSTIGTVSTLKFGLDFASISTTSTETSTQVVDVTVTDTVTQPDVTATVDVTEDVTVSSGTVTVTTTVVSLITANPNQRRAQPTPTSLPLLPEPIDKQDDIVKTHRTVETLAGRYAPAAKSCGTVITKQSTCTTTSTTTCTSIVTATVVSTSITVQPSSTTTVNIVETAYETDTATSTDVVSVTKDPETVTQTVTDTDYDVVPAATSTVTVDNPVYAKVYERTDTNGCFFNENESYLGYSSVSDNSANNYYEGSLQCANNCATTGGCVAFYLSHSTDPFGK